ncbi:hypothetical protein JOB18_030899 [Solea senegalensis]|uniref:Secreted protein n=1 Tax=Solea senegalensis TaxID=28829 RepID=A0AAV6QCY9_SOLSE|nr:hypothetical protein JOB18_030899 [Solea senegalensis]
MTEVRQAFSVCMQRGPTLPRRLCLLLMTMLRVPPRRHPMQPLAPVFPPPCALFNEDSPMQLKILASRCYCMTNRATVIPHVRVETKQNKVLQQL